MTELNFQNWGEFFEKVPFTFFRTAVLQQKYIETIDKNTAVDGRLLEIAGGSGYTSAIVADLVRTKKASVVFSDLQPSIVSGVRDTCGSIPNMNFKVADANELPFKDGSFDVIFHQGFLEHFDDQQIISFLREQARVARTIVFDVPNGRRKDKTQESGNERFLSHKRWQELVRCANLIVYETTARRFSNPWKKYVPVVLRDTEWFHRNFGEASIIVCGRL